MQTDWTLHWLEAMTAFSDTQRRAIVGAVEDAHTALARAMPPPRLDLLIAARPASWVIEGYGLSGFAYLDNLMAINCDPTGPDLLESCRNGAFTRQALHEVNHCLRMAGPGYGRTLGEAMVSEGLAGHFVIHLLGTAPEPWEGGLDPETRRSLMPSRTELDAPGYDHGAWFFGTGDLPRWLGYRLGFALVADWWQTRDGTSLRDLIDTPARSILDDQGLGDQGLDNQGT